MKINHVSEREHPYKEQRREAYGSTEEQLDMIFHQGLSAWIDHISAVKTQIPKPSDQQ